MKELRSFKDVVDNRFYRHLERAVGDYISDNLSNLDIQSCRVKT